MARRKTSKKAKSVKIDMSNVGKSFEPNQEYLVKVVECELKDGAKAPYFSLKLEGVEDFSGAFMYHNASTSEDSLWRLRPLMEAFGMDIPDGPLEISEEDFVGKSCMVSTLLDRYDGGSKIRPDEFWESEEGITDEDEDEDEEDQEDTTNVDHSFIDSLSNKDLTKLKEEFELKGRGDSLRKKLKDVDIDELVEACEDLDIEIPSTEEEEEKPKKRSSRKKKKKDPVTEETIQDMSEEELEALIEEHDLDVDLDDFKTLRKKKNAVIDAAEEAEILED